MIVGPWRQGTLTRMLLYFPEFLNKWRQYAGRSGEDAGVVHWFPCPDEDTETTPFDPHYFFQSAWVARWLARNRPQKHVDVGSQNDLVAPLSAFVDVEFIDLRPLRVSLPGLQSLKGSVLELPYSSQTVQSISCLHVVEHVGLGRYGDPLDPGGTRKACAELQRVLSPGGYLYLSTPVGHERVEFNAHRIHDPGTILRYFGELELIEFSTVDDQGVFHRSASPDDARDFRYGLGLFCFTRGAAS